MNEIPEGSEICFVCNGDGFFCMMCGGRGYVNDPRAIKDIRGD